MTCKIKLICLLLFCASLATASGQDTRRTPRLLIIGSYPSGDFNRNIGGHYEVLKAFLVNYSDDTLKYWGSTCMPGEFFTITKNAYLTVADGDCKNSEFEQESIPPQRSQLILLHLVIDNQPRRDVKLRVKMKLYYRYKSDDFEQDKKAQIPQVLTNKIILRYNAKGNPYVSRTDWENEARKMRLNLPSDEIQLLTNDERKFYKITVDSSKTTVTTTTHYPFFGKRVYHIPVTISNNSNDTLKYFSFTCSWQEFYHTDNKNIRMLPHDCIGNIPTEVIVPPHQSHTVILPLVGTDSTTHASVRFRVGLNIDQHAFRNLVTDDIDELYLYNIVWSNEVMLKID